MQNSETENPQAESADETTTPQAEVVTAEPITEEQILEIQKPNAEDFDWDAVGNNWDDYSSDKRTELEKMYEDTLKTVVENEILEGKVIGLTNKDVVINIGFKSDGLVSLSEFRHMPDIKVGDQVEVYVESQEDKNGQLILSHKKARALKSWERVNTSLEKDETITGFVKCRTKGGLIVDVFGIEAFLPGSQIDVKPIRDYDIYVGKNMEFKVVKINNEFKNVVVSHKILIEEELESQKAEIISKLEKGQVLEGSVKNITSYGVFMDLGGVDGLLHITDISWGRISHPEEVLKLDEKVNVVILDFDDEKKRIALGLKQLTPHPWDSLDEAMKVGDKVTGKVVVLADYGAFVEIATGVEGLIHVSEMSWSQHLRSPSDFLTVGQEVQAEILTLDREDRKMSLGIKQLMPDPWGDIVKKYPVGSKHKAIARNFTNFGVFVELEEGVDGLIHISDLSWSKKIKHPSEFMKVGDEIEVIVLEVDAENRRLSLGHKQLEENPWEVFETIFIVDSVHKGTIIKSTDKGAVVSLQYGVEGFVPSRHLMKADKTSAKVEETIDFKVIEFNKDSKKIVLSHSRIFEDVDMEYKNEEKARKNQEKSDTAKTAKKMKDNLEKTTLGDIEALSALKLDMETTAKNAPAADAEVEAKPKAKKAPAADAEVEAKPKAKKAKKSEEAEAEPEAEVEAKPKAAKKKAKKESDADESSEA